MTLRLTVENLSARRGDELIFQDISFIVEDGKALCVKGPNGSGKTTLLRVIAGLLSIEAGSVHLRGLPSETGHPGEACHYLGHRNAMKRELTVRENLGFWKRNLGDSSGGTGLAPEAAIEAVGLAGLSHIPFGYLSAGQQRRIAMAKLLVAHRPVWILDEPTAALDTGAEVMFAGLVTRHLEKGGIAIIATHQPLDIAGMTELFMPGLPVAHLDTWA